MKSKDIAEKVDFESFNNSNRCDPVTRDVFRKSKIADLGFPPPPEISVYDDQTKEALIFTIEFRAENLASQERCLNGAEQCATSLKSSKSDALRSWVALRTGEFLLIFIINAENFEIDGCMSLKILV